MASRNAQVQSGPLGAFALIACLFLGLFILVSIGFSLLALLMVLRWGSANYYAVSTDFYAFDAGALFFLIISGVTGGVAVSVWTWRAASNLLDWWIRGFSYSPAWSALSYWIPGVNLAAPPAVMRELWNLSDGEIPELARQSVGMVTAWWSCFAIGCLVHTLLAGVVILPLLTGIHVTNLPGANYALFCFGTLMLALAGFNLIRIIRRITIAQRSTTQVGDTFA